MPISRKVGLRAEPGHSDMECGHLRQHPNLQAKHLPLRKQNEEQKIRMCCSQQEQVLPHYIHFIYIYYYE